jgi:hypothetical protein
MGMWVGGVLQGALRCLSWRSFHGGDGERGWLIDCPNVQVDGWLAHASFVVEQAASKRTRGKKKTVKPPSKFNGFMGTNKC